MTTKITYGNLIRNARKESGLTQKELAEKVGLAEITIRQYENNKREPRIETLQKIADVLNIPTRDLSAGLLVLRLESIINEFEEKGLAESSDEDEDEGREKLREVIPIDEEYVISLIKQLNYAGLGRIYSHIEDLLQIPEYQKKDDDPE
ncbi:MAG: helix-turn-helix domain-containing protein [Oliverpabstia sp.]